jgi:hypothetical protein
MARPNQPTPTVDANDVERVVRRDFPPHAIEEILRLVADLDVREKDRVVLACLKIANGNLDRLRGELANASGYFREILSEAEYPLATRRWFRMNSLSDEEVRRIYESDWRQYREWLDRA